MKFKEHHEVKNRWIVFLVIVIPIFIFGVIWLILLNKSSQPKLYAGSDYCNTAVVKMQGIINTYAFFDEEELVSLIGSEDIVREIEEAIADPTKKAIVLVVDSPGGDIVAGEEVSNALKFSAKPTVALIRSQGLSAAYYAASGADVIFSSANSMVGGLGVTMSYLDKVEKNEREGLYYNSLSVGRYKDAGDPNKQLTVGEREVLLDTGNILYSNLLQDIAGNREIDQTDLKTLADGRPFVGTEAKENGLVDGIGDFRIVKQYLSKKIESVPVLCELNNETN